METEEKYKSLLEYLSDKVETIVEYGDNNLNEASFDYQQGVIISGNEAISIIRLLKRLLNVKEDDKILNQTLMLNWLRQWTDLYKKKKEGDFIRILRELILDYFTNDFALRSEFEVEDI